MQIRNIQSDLGNTQHNYIEIYEYFLCGELVGRDLVIRNVSGCEANYIVNHAVNLNPTRAFKIEEIDILDEDE